MSYNRMTSTPFNVGLDDGSRLSSRVLRPPGGGHTDIFGGEPEPTRGRRQVPNINTAGSQFEIASKEEVAAANQNGKQAHTPEQEPAKVESSKEAPKTVNPEPKPQPQAQEPPKRVRVPPGGFSSGLW